MSAGSALQVSQAQYKHARKVRALRLAEEAEGPSIEEQRRADPFEREAYARPAHGLSCAHAHTHPTVPQ